MLTLRKRADKTGPEPAEREAWPLASVELVGDAPKEHNFADTFVARAVQDGYLEFKNPRVETTSARRRSNDSAVDWVETPYGRDPVVSGDEIVLHLADGDLRYRVLEHPGIYEDENEPSGVRVSHEYRCKLVKTEG